MIDQGEFFNLNLTSFLQETFDEIGQTTSRENLSAGSVGFDPNELESIARTVQVDMKEQVSLQRVNNFAPSLLLCFSPVEDDQGRDGSPEERDIQRKWWPGWHTGMWHRVLTTYLP